MDVDVLTQYSEQCRNVASANGALFIDSMEVLDRALDANFNKDGYTLSPDGMLQLFHEGSFAFQLGFGALFRQLR